MRGFVLVLGLLACIACGAASYVRGDTSAIWSRMTPDMQRFMRGPDAFASSDADVRQRYGTERELLRESVTHEEGSRTYERIARWHVARGGRTAAQNLHVGQRRCALPAFCQLIAHNVYYVSYGHTERAFRWARRTRSRRRSDAGICLDQRTSKSPAQPWSTHTPRRVAPQVWPSMHCARLTWRASRARPPPVSQFVRV